MTDVAPEPVFRVASGFMAAKHLFVANEVGLFEQLADGPATLDELDRDSGRAGIGQAARDHPLRVGGREQRRLGVAAWRRLAARLRGGLIGENRLHDEPLHLRPRLRRRPAGGRRQAGHPGRLADRGGGGLDDTQQSVTPTLAETS